jgi:hypothetical protein
VSQAPSTPLSVLVGCPECGQEIAVPVSVDMPMDDEGVQRMTFEPDLSDLWAHAWTHTESA